MAAPPSIVDTNQVFAQFKEVYGDDFIKMSMVDKQLYDAFAFKKGDEPGRAYYEAIRMTEEQGFTFGVAGGVGKRLLNNAIALKTERASFIGNILEFKSEVDAEAMVRGMSTKQAFRDTVGIIQEGQRDSLFFHLEYTLLRGGAPVGVISAVAADPAANAARRLVTLSTSGYSDAFWSNSENMPLDIYDSTSAVNSGTAVRRNTVVATVLQLFRVIAWYPDTRQLLVEADTATDWTAGPVAAGDCFWRTGSYLKESMGMLPICASSAQTIFGISQSTYGKWNSFRDTVAGPLTMTRIQRAIANIRGRSAMKAAYTCRLHPLQWEAVHNDLTALRRFDSSYKVSKADAGHSEIEFFSAAGSVKILSNVFMPLDSAIITDDTVWSRRGASDVHFNMSAPGSLDVMYVVNTDSNSVQFRAYSQQGMFCNRLNRNAYLGNLDIPS